MATLYILCGSTTVRLDCHWQMKGLIAYSMDAQSQHNMSENQNRALLSCGLLALQYLLLLSVSSQFLDADVSASIAMRWR